MTAASNQGVIKSLAVGRSDIYRMDPRDLHVKVDWNCRTVNFNPEDADDLALAESISQVGVKQPLTVYTEDGKAFISDGHRRHGATVYAIQHLGAEIKSVPVQTEDRYSSEADRVFSQIVRNSGKPLTPIEQARVFKRLIDLGWTEKDIQQKTGLARQWIVELLELQAAPAAVTNLVATGQVAATLAMATLKKHGGDGVKAAGDLTRAVDKAQAEGKKRATAKHLDAGDKPKSLKDRLTKLFEGAEIFHVEEGPYTISLTPDQYAELRSALDL
ncbi:ParB/RepB/Spo0J family partition protein [Agrobacterium sp. 22-211-1]